MRSATAALVLPLLAGLAPAAAQVVQAPYSAGYAIVDLGVPSGIGLPIAGITVKADDPSVLLVAGPANATSAGLYAVHIQRDAAGHIVGAVGPATRAADVPLVDGGLGYGPNNVLFYGRYPTTTIGQVKAGSALTNRVVELASLGVASSSSSINFVPAGLPGAGRCKVATYPSGFWWDLTLAPDGNGTYDIVGATARTASQITGGPEGFAYVPAAAPMFNGPSMLVHEWFSGSIAAYAIDANGDPKPETRTTFIAGMPSAEGANFDSLSGDFLFAGYTNGHIYAVRGFVGASQASCYANCDLSATAPILNALDFGCFLTKFAAGDVYANCDGSTTAPVINALDFGCFLTKYAAGCT